jgi:hypothetical protein
MGQFLTRGVDGSIYLYVLNCSKKVHWLRVNSGEWEKIVPKSDVVSFECRPYSEVFICDENRETCLKRISVEDNDVFFRITDEKKKSLVKILDWPVPEMYRRPFYLIAHEVNDPMDIEKVLYDGANGCEIDVNFDVKSKIWYVNHDEASGVSVTEWFSRARELVLPLVVVDVKTPCPGWQLMLLLDQIRMTKFRHGILISVSTEVDCLLSLENKLHANEGIATDYLKVSPELMSKFPEDANLWYGNGIASMLPKPGLYNGLRDAVYLRNKGKKIKKVYAWTFNSSYSFSEYLLLDLDGMMVEKGFVGEARSLLEKSPFYRMAEVKDDVFQKSMVSCV